MDFLFVYLFVLFACVFSVYHNAGIIVSFLFFAFDLALRFGG